MSYIYFCAKSPKNKTELISADEREARWLHLSDLDGILITEQKISRCDMEFSISKKDEMREKYSGIFQALD